uniref:GDNF/GAS1 domain-containing protein n=1 Tax=Lates calcarifer TaxID=8187 RepID=A0A4W6E5C8_LATCA
MTFISLFPLTLLIHHLPSLCPLLDALPSSASIFPLLPSSTDCVEAHRVCSADPQCEALYRGLELCAADAAVSLLGEQVAAECLERQDALLAKHPALLACKCHRGLRKEEQCLRIYWRVRLLPGESGLGWGRLCMRVCLWIHIGSWVSIQQNRNRMY